MSKRSTTRLRQMIESDGIHVAPGAYDGLSARLVEESGSELLYASGGAIARSCGVPDIGLLSLTEVAARIEQMVDVTRLPVIADADTGFGNAVNAVRTLALYERIGVAGMHIEDQTFPKRCGHLDDKSLVSTDEMVRKIQAVSEARTDPDFVLIARTDAIATEGLDAAIERAHAYVEAGADVIFVEAPESVEQIERIAARIPQPKLINMFHGGKTPLVPKERLRELGYRLIIIPSDLQRAVITAVRRTLEAINRDGDSGAVHDDMASFAERERIVRTAEYLAIGS
ncbi:MULTISPECIES: oxaloacetate decarboxylase [Streptomyces]|uniref:isocitrate lyase/PEP mutase family protein n=1 Tax=Streptomyces TaxID=1883 RepID=UPI00103C80E2|nr:MULTISPECIES: oxaloacetate decarboxylase [Streptomyces]MBT3073289.1 oxaloacetate decarboxylase [Streptomyces sp. COG21]MBT3081690.1 oxaloacetate decarboxylase [Streptomyces sp. COG20]MBT3085138.1 oxaloacetate decarboxylase [Streptomyces sp. CYG21]MBT3100219.1 oxaloacetate decarboxylase [Streptomyces sp. CBG30]MBT3105619.1 oxaloacetate decarboxylase [Streptomyces sp. COG19]